MIESQRLVAKISEYYDTFYKRNERTERIKKDEVKESIDQTRIALGSGAIAAFAARWPIAGTLLSAGSGLLGFENLKENVASFASCFKSENLEWYNVRLISNEKISFFTQSGGKLTPSLINYFSRIKLKHFLKVCQLFA